MNFEAQLLPERLQQSNVARSSVTKHEIRPHTNAADVAGTGDALWPSLLTALAWICAIPGLVLSYYAAFLYVPMARTALREGRAARSRPAAG